MSNIQIGQKQIGHNAPCFIIAEMSANHDGKLENALEIIRLAKDAGADAVKIQTYTADTITIDCDKPDFQLTQGTIWDGITLHKLYEKAYTPWEWHEALFVEAKKEDIILFSSPFDLSSIDFLEGFNVPAYKIASYEINDIPLITKAAKTNKPIIISTGIAYVSEIDEAVRTCRAADNDNVALLKCMSAYPSPFSGLNLRTIPNMAQTYGCVTGVSDHTLGMEVALGSVALGARVIEKHMTIDRAKGGVDASFSMEPHEFKAMVKAVRNLEAALGDVCYDLTEKQIKSREHSRSLYAVKDISPGEEITTENVRSIRPGFGLHTRYYDDILGKKARAFIEKGTALRWDMFL